MHFSKSLNALSDRAKEKVEQVEVWATRPNPPVWQVVVGAVIVIVLMRVLVVAF